MSRQVDPPTWSTWTEAVAVVGYPAHLRKTSTIALIVGTVLFAINQLDVVVRGDATPLVWAKAAVTYVVPFVVSNLGVLVGSRQRTASEVDPPSAAPGPKMTPGVDGLRYGGGHHGDARR